MDEAIEEMGFPIVIKAPYTRFSSYVEKAEDIAQFKSIAARFLKRSKILVLQEYLRSDFDWRVGVLDGEVIFLCKYFFPVNSWKICTHTPKGIIWGDTVAIDRKKIPRRLKELSERTARLVGDGLYGLDVKEKNGDYKVIEINDNPSIHHGYEDAPNPDIYGKIIGKLAS